MIYARTSTRPTSVQRPGSRWARYAAAVEDGTAPVRERALDFYRALATAGVVLGHWLVGGLVLGSGGALRIDSPLRYLERYAPATWVLQMLGLFFFVGGYASARSLARAQAGGGTYGTWLRARAVRMGRPVVAGLALSCLALGMLAALGVPAGSLRVWVVLFVQPLWFIAMYGAATALTPLVVRADRRLGFAAAGTLAGIVAVVDLLRYGPWAAQAPGWWGAIGLVSIVPGWLFAYQLGVAWSAGRLHRAGWPLLVGGVAVFALLIGPAGYPMSMIGIPDAARSNALPPSLLVLALASTQAGAAVLLRDRLERVMRRRRGLWAAVASVNVVAMTVFCWHQVPLVLAGIAGAELGGLPGLNNHRTMWVGCSSACSGSRFCADSSWRSCSPRGGWSGRGSACRSPHPSPPGCLRWASSRSPPPSTDPY